MNSASKLSTLTKDTLKNFFTLYSLGDKMSLRQFITFCKRVLSLQQYDISEIKRLYAKFANERKLPLESTSILTLKDFEDLMQRVAIVAVKEGNNASDKLKKLLDRINTRKIRKYSSTELETRTRNARRYATQIEFPNIIDANIEQALKVLNTHKTYNLQLETLHRPIESFGTVLRPRFFSVLSSDTVYGFDRRDYYNRTFVGNTEPIFEVGSPREKEVSIEESEELKEFMEIEKSLNPEHLAQHKKPSKSTQKKKKPKAVKSEVKFTSNKKDKDRENVGDLVNATPNESKEKKSSKIPKPSFVTKDIKQTVTNSEVKERTLKGLEMFINKRIAKEYTHNTLRRLFIGWRNYLRERKLKLAFITNKHKKHNRLSYFLSWKSKAEKCRYKKQCAIYKLTTILKQKLRKHLETINEPIPIKLILFLSQLIRSCNNYLHREKEEIVKDLIENRNRIEGYRKELRALRIEFGNKNPWYRSLY